MTLAEQAVDAINAVSGRHDGFRAAHAKGTLFTGTFTATAAAAELTRAPHMTGETVKTTVRLSNGGGNPEMPDYAREGRGLAVKFYLPDGGRTDMVALTLPVFFVRTPEDFVEFTTVRRPDPETGKPDFAKIGAFLEAHPESQPAVQAALGAPPPASYAQCLYNGIHAFRWIDGDGVARDIRYRWEPEAGEASISDEEARERGRHYLREEITARLQEGPAAFRLVVVLADGDPTHDPTIGWPEDRETVEVGRLEVTGLDTERERDGDVLVFDPVRVCDGIELSDDPILQFRSDAYAVSVLRRSGERRDD